jgi:hypothetical protein
VYDYYLRAITELCLSLPSVLELILHEIRGLHRQLK